MGLTTSGHLGEYKNLTPQPGIEQFLSLPAHSLVIHYVIAAPGGIRNTRKSLTEKP
jgi:hypothetical protein